MTKVSSSEQCYQNNVIKELFPLLHSENDEVSTNEAQKEIQYLQTTVIGCHTKLPDDA